MQPTHRQQQRATRRVLMKQCLGAFVFVLAAEPGSGARVMGRALEVFGSSEVLPLDQNRFGDAMALLFLLVQVDGLHNAELDEEDEHINGGAKGFDKGHRVERRVGGNLYDVKQYGHEHEDIVPAPGAHNSWQRAGVCPQVEGAGGGEREHKIPFFGVKVVATDDDQEH